jgi:hypothetical protein
MSGILLDSPGGLPSKAATALSRVYAAAKHLLRDSLKKKDTSASESIWRCIHNAYIVVDKSLNFRQAKLPTNMRLSTLEL